MRYTVSGSTAQQIRDIGGTDIKEAKSVNLVFTTLTDAQVIALKSQGADVQAVKSVKVSVTTPTPVAAIPTYTPTQLVTLSGLEQLRAATKPMLYGHAMNIAIIGTGIRETHELIKGRVIYSKNFTSDAMTDGFNHDTGVCSIVVVCAPQCNILNFKVMNSKGEGTEEEVIMALDHCIDMRTTDPTRAPSVVNLSLGAEDSGDPNDALRVACRAAIKSGIWLLAACGNEGPNPSTITCPATERYVIAIGSAKTDPYSVSSFSSRGPTKEGLIKPDVIFFGEDIDMASSASDTATIAKSGTSFATPFVSGLAVLYQEAMLVYGGPRELQYPVDLPGPDYPTVTELVSVQDMLDKYIGTVSMKPQGYPATKDNETGWGMVYGPYIAKAFAPSGVAIMQSMLALLPAMMVVGMMAKVMKQVNIKPAKTKVESTSYYRRR